MSKRDDLEKSRKDNTAAERPKRVPIYNSRVMDVGKIPGKKLRWVNDDPGRIEMFKRAGYVFVRPEDVQLDPKAQDSKYEKNIACKVVDSVSGKRAYLMAIDEELYVEDQGVKQQNIDYREQLITRQAQNEIGGETYGSVKTGRKN